jgi:NAD(P) transhydrogenase subunit beta
MEISELIIQAAYLVAVSLFIMGLQKLSSPATARKGNFLSACGMFVAVVATMFKSQVISYEYILAGIVLGAIIGAIAATKVEMTSMPQLVALFNGFGGAGSTLVAMGEYFKIVGDGGAPSIGLQGIILVSTLIGGITFTGSLLAFGKLQGIIGGSPITFPGQKIFNAAVFVGFLYFMYQSMILPVDTDLFWVLLGISLALGILLVIPIGGADMPVVISLLNSFSGVAAGLAGFVVKNNVLIVSGALVGSAGLILTLIMCKGMNRSIANVIFGAFGTEGGAVAGGGSDADKSATTIDSEQAAMMLAYANSVVIVPGYGMAVAQAQHAVRELTQALENRGVEVKFAIHPVAGRMPGHMNVLLAEANVPYPQLYDMSDINSEFPSTDVALVIGANDVVNPAAKTDPSSPIYGMPVLDVEDAKACIVIKRSLNTGFAGIDNELFYADKTSMLLGGAKDMVSSIIQEAKEL